MPRATSPFCVSTSKARSELLRQGLVKLDDLVGDAADIHLLHPGAEIACFRAGDHQERVEDADEAVRLVDDGRERRAIFFRRFVAAQRRLRAIAQTRQRRLEVMRDIVGDLAQPPHQLTDALQHRVEISRETIELVARIGSRQPFAQIARHDASRRGGELLDSLKHAISDIEATECANQSEPE